MNNVLLGIVIPNFNHGGYLERAIESVLAQDYPNVELIVVDGGSTDSSLDVIRRHSHRLAWWVSETDAGQGEAINKGFAHCTGEIVTFLGSDDSYAPGTLSDVVERFRENPQAGAVIGAFQVQDENSRIVSEPVPPHLAKPTPLDLTLLDPSQYRLHQVAAFYSRAALEKIGFHVREDLRYVMDRELLYRVCRQFPVTLTERVYGLFRRHEASKSVNSILPFAREFADLYLQAKTGNPSDDRQRERNANVILAHGWIRNARAAKRFSSTARSLLRVPRLAPDFLFRYSYLAAWRDALLGRMGGTE